ncbi:MAG TPA: hypothetical protein VMF52_15740 [Steroidobacteraceae bacterium]|nr:hypothetical protein [Steroidobacteraceae bacterium]
MASVVLTLRPGFPVSLPEPAPLRRRVIVIGATEAGVSAAFHLGKSALLIEQRAISADAGPPQLHVWQPPQLGEAVQPVPPAVSWDYLLRELVRLSPGETRLGARVGAIHAAEHRLRLADGDSYVYDKLVSALRPHELLRLIVDDRPAGALRMEDWRDWLNGHDIELLDTTSQVAAGDVDGQTAGMRVAATVAREMAEKYSAWATRLQPRALALVPG